MRVTTPRRIEHSSASHSNTRFVASWISVAEATCFAIRLRMLSCAYENPVSAMIAGPPCYAAVCGVPGATLPTLCRGCVAGRLPVTALGTPSFACQAHQCAPTCSSWQTCHKHIRWPQWLAKWGASVSERAAGHYISACVETSTRPTGPPARFALRWSATVACGTVASMQALHWRRPWTWADIQTGNSSK